MAQVDGTLVFDTRLDKRGLLQGLRECEIEAGESDAGASATTKAIKELEQANKRAMRENEKATVAVGKQLDKVREKIAKTEAQLDAMYEARGQHENAIAVPGLSDEVNAELAKSNAEWQKHTAEIQKVERELQGYQKELEPLLEKERELKAVAMTQRNERVAGANETTAAIREETVAEAQAGSTASFAKRMAAGAAKAYRATLERVIDGHKQSEESVKKMETAAKKGFKSASNSASHFQKRLLGIASSALIFSQVYRAIHSFLGFMGDAAKSNDEFSESLQRIKGNMLTAFAPIYNAVMPFINWLMSGLEKVSAILAKISAQLFGYTVESAQEAAQGIQDNIDAMDGFNESATAAKRAVAGFDELNNLSMGSSSSGSSSGVGTGSGNGSTELKFSDASEFKVPEVVETTWEITCKLLDGAGNAIDWVWSAGNKLYSLLSGDKTDYGTPEEQRETIAETFQTGEYKDVLALWAEESATGVTEFMEDGAEAVRHFFLGTEVSDDNVLMSGGKNGKLGIFSSTWELLNGFLYGDKMSDNNMYKAGYHSAEEWVSGFIEGEEYVAPKPILGADELAEGLMKWGAERRKQLISEKPLGTSEELTKNPAIQQAYAALENEKTGFWAKGKELIDNLAGGLTENKPTFLGKVKEVFVNASETLTESTKKGSTYWNSSTAAGANAVGGVNSGLSNNQNNLKTAFVNALTTAANDANTSTKKGTSFWTTISTLGKNVAEGILAGLDSKKNSLANGIKGIADNLVSKFKETLGIHSPSTAFEDEAYWIPQGINRAIVDGEASTMQIIRNYAKRLPDAWTTPVFSTGTYVPAGISANSTGSENNTLLRELVAEIRALKTNNNGQQKLSVELVGEMAALFTAIVKEKNRQTELTGVDPLLGV